MSMFACIQQLNSGSSRTHHIIANSTFAATKSFKELLKLYNTYVTISINNSLTSDMSSLYTFISQDLLRGQARLYHSPSCLVKVVQHGEYTSTIAINAFKVKKNTLLAPTLASTTLSHSVKPSNAAGPSTSPTTTPVPLF